MNTTLFGFVAGTVLAFAGVSLVEQPLKFVVLTSMLVVAHVIAKEMK